MKRTGKKSWITQQEDEFIEQFAKDVEQLFNDANKRVIEHFEKYVNHLKVIKNIKRNNIKRFGINYSSIKVIGDKWKCPYFDCPYECVITENGIDHYGKGHFFKLSVQDLINLKIHSLEVNRELLFGGK